MCCFSLRLPPWWPLLRLRGLLFLAYFVVALVALGGIAVVFQDRVLLGP
jgi:hypothetical protein